MDLSAVTRWITVAPMKHGHDLPRYLGTFLGIDAVRSRDLLQKPVNLQWLSTVGPGDNRTFAPDALRQVVRRYPQRACTKTCPGAATLHRISSCHARWHAWPSMRSPSC